MVLCPVALAIGCRKCPVFAVCPLKSTIGDYVPPATPQAAGKAGAMAKAGAAKKPAAGKAKAAAGRAARDTGTRRRSRRDPS